MKMELSRINELLIDKDFEELLPPLTVEEFEYLEGNILQVGCRDAIVTWKGYVVDGHNRRNICLKYSLQCNVIEMDTEIYKNKDDVINWMIENQLGRRNLSLTERYEVVQKHKSAIESKARQNMSNAGKGLSTLSKVNTRKEMAKLVGTSEGTYSKLDKIFESNDEAVKQEIKEGTISVNKAFEKVAPKESKQVTVDFSGVMNALETSIANANDTYECDRLLEQLKDHLQQVNKLKDTIYNNRRNQYENMVADNMSCVYEEIEKDNMFGHNFVFYLVKTVGGISNRKEVIKLSEYCMETEERYLEEIAGVEKLYPSKEATIICMAITKAREEFLIYKQEENRKKEEKRKRLYEEINKADKAYQGFQELQDIFTISEEVKIMMSDITKIGYKQLAKKYHPDVCGDTGEAMTNLNIAKGKLDKIIGC
jgi:curved DNA-binding protein CbpA